MAPQTRARPKASTAEAAAMAVAPTTPRAKRSRASAASVPPAQALEDEANNSAHGGTSQGSYETLQQELAVLRQELANLRQRPETTLAAALR